MGKARYRFQYFSLYNGKVNMNPMSYYTGDKLYRPKKKFSRTT